MTRELNESQIKRINSTIKKAGFRGYTDEDGGSAEIPSFSTPGCSVSLYFRRSFGERKMKIKTGHSSLGGDKILNLKASIRNLTKGVKLAEKIQKIINE